MRDFMRPLDLWILERVFQPLTIWIHKYAGVNNYTIAKWLSVGLKGIVVGGIFLIGLDYATGGNPFIVICVWFLSILLNAQSLQKCAANLETHYIHLYANGQLPDYRDGTGREVRMRRELSPVFFLCVTLFFFAVVRQIERGDALAISDLTICVVLTSCCIYLSGLYFLGCMAPPPHNRRQRASAPAETQFAW